jgi:two-component sensor histidine kinase
VFFTITHVGFSQNPSNNQGYIITKRLLSVEDGLPSRLVNDAVQDKQGFMWFATANGISRYDGKTFKNYNTHNSKIHFDDVVNIFVDAKNRLHIHFKESSAQENTHNNMQVLDLNDYTFKDIQSNISPNSIDSAQSFNRITPKYFIDKQNQWFLFFDNKYVAIRDIKDVSLEGENSIHSVFRDKLNNFWFSTPRGIYQVAIQLNKFQHFFDSDQINKFKFSTRGIYAEDDQQQDNKKSVYALSEFQNFRVQTPKGFAKLNAPGGYALLKKNDIFYISSNRLFSYYPAKDLTRALTTEIIGSPIWSLASFSDSIILMGGSSGILLFNEISQKTSPIRLLQNVKQSPVNIYRILKTKQKGWIAVAENGIYFINTQFEIFDYYGSKHPESEKRLPFTGIFDFYEDKQGIAWLAMNGEGLIRWNWNAANPMSKENFKKFTVNDGLPDDILYRIEEDDLDNLWISSYNGLLKLHKPDLTTKIYTSKDGLANAEFNRISSFKDKEGWMYFGGFNGIDAFNPSEMNTVEDDRSFPFQLVDFTKFSEQKNRLVDVLDEYHSTKKMTMNVGDRFLTVSFSLLDFEKRTHRYRYRIEGMDKDWNYINENTIRISGLPYGKLTLRIEAQCSSGVWNAQEISITIDVMKPFYLQWWFWIVSMVIMLISLFLINSIRIKQLKKANQKLEIKVLERTHKLIDALNEKDQLLSEKNILLTEVHHRVKNNLQVIIGLLELRKEGIEDEKARAAFDEGKSGVTSIAVIHELLYRNDNNGTLDFSVIVKSLTIKMAQLFVAQNKSIQFVIGDFDKQLNIDKSVTLGLILSELLNNAYKYLPANSSNKVLIDLIPGEDGNCIFTFHDNGPGLINTAQFYRATTEGFSIVKRLAKQLKGKASYEFDSGSKFVIQFKDDSTHTRL